MECACYDCRTKLEYAISQGFKGKCTGFNQIWQFGNAFASVEGQELMKKYQLREGAESTFIMTECCKTVLLVDHPAYQGNFVMAGAEMCNITCDMSMKPTARIHIQEWDSQYGEMPPNEGTSQPLTSIWDFK